MANLRRHFNLNAKQPSLGDQVQEKLSLPVTELTQSVQLDKCSLMNDICNSLDLCCSYIQALNSLCGAGTLLARNLLQTVQEVPAYHNVAMQFLSVWEEVGKATAGASAAVKTETLMMLQDVLNTLEGASDDATVDETFTDSFQVIGSCLFSYIELQAQFSLSTWKSLSKLSKSLSNEGFQNTLRHSSWKSPERSVYKFAKYSDLSSTIKRHFSQLIHKLGGSKSESIEVPQSQFYVPPSVQREENISGYHGYLSQTIPTSSVSDPVVWSPSTTLWSAANDGITSASHPSSSQVSGTQATESPPPTHSELDEVINLLSCMPGRQLTSTDSHSATQFPGVFESSPDTQSLHRFWPQGSAPVLSRHMANHRSWSEGPRGVTFGYDSWIWRSDNLNCSGLPHGDFQKTGENDPNHEKRNTENQTLWNNIELQRWNIGIGENGSSSDDASSNQGQEADSLSYATSQSLGHHLLTAVRHRRHSSSDGLPDGAETLPDSRERTFWKMIGIGILSNEQLCEHTTTQELSHEVKTCAILTSSASSTTSDPSVRSGLVSEVIRITLICGKLWSMNSTTQRARSAATRRTCLTMNTRNQKTCTWPLKQSSSRIFTDAEWSDGTVDSKFAPVFFTQAS